MASVALSTLWLSDAADLSDFISFPLMSKLTPTEEINGDFREYAGGVQRLMTRPGEVTTVPVTLTCCDRAQVNWLRAHKGRVLLVRDNTGRKVYGAYKALSMDEDGAHDVADVDLTISSLFFDEEV